MDFIAILCAISQIPHSGQILHTHWFLRQFWTGHTYCSRESMTAPGFAERFLFGEQKGKGKITPHTSLCCLGKTGTSHISSQNYATLLSKSNQAKPRSSLPLSTRSICAVSVSDVKPNHRHSKIKQEAARGGMQQKGSRKIPTQPFLDKILP